MDRPEMAAVPIINNDYTMTMYDSTGKQYTLSPLPPNPFPNQCYPQNPNSKHPPDIQPCFTRPCYPVQGQPCMSWPNQFHPNCTGSMPSMRSQATEATPEKIISNRSHTASQVVDGRYASTYQTTVCKLQPTSPTLITTEFPPQRRHVPRGHGNFQVGGTGSGDPAPTPVQINNNFRGGLSWCDRGSVYLTQPSYECQQNNMFTRSLRKYPRISLERSSEIVERLISYTQAKNSVYNQGNQTEPSRSRSRSPTKTSKRFDSPPRSFRIDENPTRDGSRNTYYKNYYDVRNLREISQMIRENVSRRNSPVRHTVRSRNSSPRRERLAEKKPAVVESTAQTMVNKETQVAAEMVCRETCASPQDIERTVSPTVVEVCAADPTCNAAGILGRKSLRSRGPARGFNSSPPAKGSNSTAPVQGISSTGPLGRSPKLSCHRQRLRVVGSRRCFQRVPVHFSRKCPSNRRFSKKMVIHKSCEANINNTGALRKYVQTICPSITVTLKHTNSSTSISPVSNAKTPVIDTRNSISDTGVLKGKKLILHTNISQAEDYTKEAVSSWLSSIPWKAYDFLGRPVEKDKILNYVVHRLLMISSKFNEEHFRKEILDIVSDIPFRIPKEKKVRFIRQSTEDLINILNSGILGKIDYGLPQNINETNAGNDPEDFRPLDEEIKKFVKTELQNAIVNHKLEIDPLKKNDVEVVLFELLIDFLESRDENKEEQVIKNTILTLERTGHLLKLQAVNFVQKLMKNFKERFLNAANDSKTARNQNLNSIENHTESLDILNSIHGMNDSNDALGFEIYTQRLSHIIDKWLTKIESRIPQIRNIIYRNIIIKDLTQYIIDRRRYLEMCFSKPMTKKCELNYLKYQILRWVNKLVGGNKFNVAMLEKVSELMRKIKNVPVPAYTKNIKIRKISTPILSPTSKRSKLNLYQTQNTVRSNVALTVNVVQTVDQSTPGEQNVSSEKSMNQSNNNITKVASSDQSFDNFLKEWIENVPPVQNTAEESESMKVALYNGVWKILTKLKLSPQTKNYPALYEEALEEELDTLLTSIFSQTSELMIKTTALKSQLIAKAKVMNESIKNAALSKNFRDNVKYKIQEEVTRIKHNDRKDDTINNLEELRIQSLAEQYVLYCKYISIDRTKAETHRLKLLRSVQDFVRELKAAYIQHNKDIDEETCVATIMQAMLEVPLPSQDTLDQEADEILLGFEIDRWFSDLPLYRDDSPGEQIKRRRLRDNLARKLHSLDYDIAKGNGSAENTAIHEILLVLDKLPLIRNASLNVSFIGKELLNRIKNRRSKERMSNVDKSMPISQLVDAVKSGPSTPMPERYTLPDISATFEPPGASTTYTYPGQESFSHSIHPSTVYSANQSRNARVSQENIYQGMPVGMQRRSMTNTQISSRPRNSQQQNSFFAASRRENERNSNNLNESIPISELVDAIKPPPSTPIRERVNYTLPSFNETFEPSASTRYRQPAMESSPGSRPIYYESRRTDSQVDADNSVQGTPIQYYTLPESPQSYPQAVKVTRLRFNEGDDDIPQCCKDEMPCCDVVLGKMPIAKPSMYQPTSVNAQQQSINRPQIPFTSIAPGGSEDNSYYTIPPYPRMPPQVDPNSSELRQTSPKSARQTNINIPQNLDESVNISKLVSRFEARPRPSTPIRERVNYTLPDVSETFEPSASTPYRQPEKDSLQGSRPIYYESTRIDSQMGADYLDQDTPIQYYTIPNSPQPFPEQTILRKISLTPTSPNAQHQSINQRQTPNTSGDQGAPTEYSYYTTPYSPQTQRPSLKTTIKPYTHGDGIPKCCRDKMSCCDETLRETQESPSQPKTSPGEIRPQKASPSFMSSRQTVNQLPDYPNSSQLDIRAQVTRSPRQHIQTYTQAPDFYESVEPEKVRRFARRSNVGVSFRQNMSQAQSEPSESIRATIPPATPGKRSPSIYQDVQLYPRAPEPIWDTLPPATPGAYPPPSYPRSPAFQSASPVDPTWQGYQVNPDIQTASPVGTTLPGYRISSAIKQAPYIVDQATSSGQSQSCCQDEVCPKWFSQQQNIPGKPVFSSTPYKNEQESTGIPRGTQLPRRWNSEDDYDGKYSHNIKQQLKAVGDMLIAASSSTDSENHDLGRKSSSSEGIKTQTEASMKIKESVIYTNEKRVQAEDNTSYFAMFTVGKPKSHEEVTSLKTDEVFIWLQQVCNSKNVDFSINKLNELSAKLKQTGGPEYIQSKIKRYLKRIPDQFSADDKFGQKIRKKLPNYIVTKLKKFFDKQEKNSVDIPSLVYNMKQDQNDIKTKTLRSILKTWIESIPMQQQGGIAKKSIYNLLMDRIQQLLLHHPKNRDAFKDLLRTDIVEIAQQIPFDDVVKNQNMENIVQDLVEKVEAVCLEKSGLNMIITESIHNICLKKRKVLTMPELQSYISEEMKKFFSKLHVDIRNDKKQFIVRDIIKLLSSREISKDDTILDGILSLLIEDGVPEPQAMYISEKIFKAIRTYCSGNEHSLKKRNGEPFSVDAKLVNSNRRSEQNIIENDNPHLREYYGALSSCVHKWLSQFQDCVPTIKSNSFKNVAVDGLVRMITNRFETFKSESTENPAKESPLHGADQIKSLIGEWIAKFKTKDTAKIMQGVPELVDKLYQVPFPVSSSQISTQRAVDRSAFFNKKFSYEIFNWYNQLSSGFHVKKEHYFPNKLVEKLVAIVDSDSVEESIDREINSWASKVLKDNIASRELSDLKTRIMNVIQSRTVVVVSPSQTPLATSQTNFKTTNMDLKVQNEILEWIQGLSFTVDNFGRSAMKSLASDIEARRKHLEQNPSQKGTEEEELEILKFIVFKKMDRVDDKDSNKLIANIPQLMQRLNKLYQRTHSNALGISSAKSNTATSIDQGTVSQKFIPHENKTNEKLDTVCNTDKSCLLMSLNKDNETSGSLCNGNIARRGENKSVTVVRQIQVNNDPKQHLEITSEGVSNQVKTNANRKPENFNIDKHQRDIKNIEHNQVSSTRETSCSSQATNAMINNTDDDIFSFYEMKNNSNVPKKRRNLWKINQSTDCQSYKASVYTAPSEIRANTRRDSQSIADFPEGKNLAKIYEYFDEVFKKHCDDLPFDDLTQEQKIFATESKVKVYSGIWKTYLRLKSDSGIESDYSLFADILKDELYNILEFLPKSEPLEAFKMLWIDNVVKDVMNLLRYVHSLAGINSYREILAEKFDRKFIKQYNLYLSNKIQYIYIAKTIDIYILFTRYKQSDRKRASVYKKRFIARLEELVDHVQNELGFQYIDKRQFCKEVFKSLHSVPLPEPDNLQQEADEALIRDEMEIWYNELPVFPVNSELDNVLRNADREELAKLLHIIENELWPDSENIRKKMIQEVIWFLQVDAHLNPEYEGHISLLAEDLVRRIENRSHRVLDENALEQSLNQSLNNTTLYPNSMYQSVMPALVSQKINTRQMPSNEERNANVSKDVSSDSYNTYNKSFYTAEESDSNVSQRNKNITGVGNANAKERYAGKGNVLNPEIVNAKKNHNYGNDTVRSDDQLGMQYATPVSNNHTPAYQTELFFDETTKLYKPRRS